MDKTKLLEGLKKIKEAFGTAQSFVDAKLMDGVTIIRYNADALAKGVPVMIVTESGEMPISDGEYELVDGTKFVIIEGIVSEVMEAEQKVESKAPTGTQAPAPASEMSESKVKSIIESTIREQRFVTEDALNEALSKTNKVKEDFEVSAKKQVNELKEKIEKQDLVITQMFALLEKIGDEPVNANAENKYKAKTKTSKEIALEFKNALK